MMLLPTCRGGEMKVLMALQPGTLTKNYINTY